MTKEQSFYLQTPDGKNLSCRFAAGSESKFGAVIVHGYAEHCRRYDHVSAWLQKLGFNVVRYDQRGHGDTAALNNDALGYLESAADLASDLNHLLKYVQSEYKFEHNIVVAHSMGGGVALRTAIEYAPPVSTYVLSGPLVQVSEDLSPVLQKVAHILSRIVPRLAVGDSGGTAILSRDPEVGKKFDADPLCYSGKVMARTGSELLKLGEWVESRLDQMRTSFLVLHGGADRLVMPSGSKTLFSRAGSQQKKHVELPEMFHEIFNEIDNQAVYDAIEDWLGELGLIPRYLN